jgi:lipopolysaccharide/colanic/teichoic acid biosynthesis glycosyltransferase
MSRNFQPFIKRVFDIVICSAVLLVCFPILLLLALLVKISSEGPVFFVQVRIGRNEKPYKIIKFRTMLGHPDKHTKSWTTSDETRITPIGRIMRDYGLDELPQLFNILKGDMSIIGPRSPLPEQLTIFSGHFKKMFRMRPGVLSLAAIAGRRSLTLEERYDLHVRYVETWSMKLDLTILWRSLFVVLRRESATEILPEE